MNLDKTGWNLDSPQDAHRVPQNTASEHFANVSKLIIQALNWDKRHMNLDKQNGTN